jgi:hypothetical protein
VGDTPGRTRSHRRAQRRRVRRGRGAWAFRLSDGAELWEAAVPSLEGLAGSGEVEIGNQGPDLIVDRKSGDLAKLDHTAGDKLPKGMRRFPAPRPTRYLVQAGLKRTVARKMDGSVAWRITVETPMFDPVQPIEVPGGMVLLTSSGHLVALDYR